MEQPFRKVGTIQGNIDMADFAFIAGATFYLYILDTTAEVLQRLVPQTRDIMQMSAPRASIVHKELLNQRSAHWEPSQTMSDWLLSLSA